MSKAPEGRNIASEGANLPQKCQLPKQLEGHDCQSNLGNNYRITRMTVLPTLRRTRIAADRQRLRSLSIAMVLIMGCAFGFCADAFQQQSSHPLRKCLGRCDSYSAGTSYHNSQLFIATEPTRLVTSETFSNQPNPNKNDDDDDDDSERLTRFFHQHLDAAFRSRRRLTWRPEAGGRLQLGREGPVLFEGLSSEEWTPSEPTMTVADPSMMDDQCTSAFLQPKGLENLALDEHRLSLGNLVGCQRLLACARLNRYWMGPAFGNKASHIPHDTQFLLVQVSGQEKNEEELYALVLPLVHGGFRCTLQGTDDTENSAGSIEVRCFSEGGTPARLPEGMKGVYVAMGDDPFQLLKQGFQEVSEATGSFQTLHQKSLPPSVDNFGWCTWDAFYSKVRPEGILQGVQALKNAGVPPKTVILDDGWQVVEPVPKSWREEDEETSDMLTASSTSSSSSDSSSLASLPDTVFNKFASAITNYYTRRVEDAPHGSAHNRIWRFLAKTVLKAGLWNFFDSETDFARQLGSFEPNFKFEKSQNPDGSAKVTSFGNPPEISSLKDLVSELKTSLGVHHVYCWHAIHGYWRGISSELGESIGVEVLQVNPKASQHVLSLEPQAAFDPPSLFGVGVMQKKEDIETFYKHIHAPLVEAGIDGVKVDVQSGVTAAGSGLGYGTPIARLYTQAMEDSVSQNFRVDEGRSEAIHCINCMCHSTENLYRYKTTAIARASEDFFPDKPESHSVHLVNVAYNSLFLGEICLPDWDMFHSQHESAVLHAAARSIGGCPIYVSDVPGEHDTELLKKLVLPDGSILRGSMPGRPTRDSLFADVGQDHETALKIWNSNPGSNGGVVGAFHVQGVAWSFDKHKNEVINQDPKPIVTSIRPFDIESLRPKNTLQGSQSYAIWQHRKEALTVVEDGNQSVDIKLTSHDWEIFTVVPVERHQLIRWAPIGLSNMFNSGGALQSVNPLRLDGGDVSARVSVRGPGKLVSYCHPEPESVSIDGVPVSSYSYDSAKQTLSITLPIEESKKYHDVHVYWDRHDAAL